jgi:hypothetical protein
MTADELADWPRDPANGRLLCAPGKPMPVGAPGQWAHMSVCSNGADDDPYYDHRACLDCGMTWLEEVPE